MPDLVHFVTMATMEGQPNLSLHNSITVYLMKQARYFENRFCSVYVATFLLAP